MKIAPTTIIDKNMVEIKIITAIVFRLLSCRFFTEKTDMNQPKRAEIVKVPPATKYPVPSQFTLPIDSSLGVVKVKGDEKIRPKPNERQPAIGSVNQAGIFAAFDACTIGGVIIPCNTFIVINNKSIKRMAQIRFAV
mmetsp:Transcript_28355/g.37759  ORF Transcript_28355/g.37759 Transcript_28355/m.37759 type:complete len:137 (-) Transcript_28355:1205-1615(-)